MILAFFGKAMMGYPCEEDEGEEEGEATRTSGAGM
ncbi:hypothetical protein EMIT0194MI4_50413 [Pseudomonas sp. IT-194MI4]